MDDNTVHTYTVLKNWLPITEHVKWLSLADQLENKEQCLLHANLPK